MYLFSGFGNVFMFLAPMSDSMNNFPVRVRGLIIGLTGACSMAGATIFGGIYAGVFTEGPLGNYFLLLSIFCIVVNLLSMWTLKTIPLQSDSDAQEEERTENVHNHSLFNNDNNEPADSWYERFGMRLMKIPAFHILSWGYMLSAVPTLAIDSNITTIAASLGFSILGVSVPVYGPITSLITSLVIGLISDRSLQYVSRLSYALIVHILLLFFFILATFYGDNFHVLLGLLLATYVHIGFALVIFPTVVAEYFGNHYFIRIWGAILLAVAILTTVLNVIIGGLYIDTIPGGGTDCYGLVCFQRTFILSSVMCAVAILLTGLLWYLERKKSEYEKIQ